MKTFENAVQQARECFPRHWRTDADFPAKCELLAAALVLGLPVADVKRSIETGSPGWRQLAVAFIERRGGTGVAPLAVDLTPPVQS